jgi:hypothetical protein
MKTTPATLGIRVGTIVTALAVALSLAGCVQPIASTPNTDGSASPTPTQKPTPTVTPTNEAFVENCGTLITADQIYAYNPNYVVDTSYAPKAGTLAAAVKAQLGQTCGWVNESSGAVLEVAVASPTPSAFAAAKAAAANGSAISANGEQGYFGVEAGIGSAQFFIGRLWLVVSSPDFATPGDAEAICPVVVKNQMTAGG